MQMLDPHGEGQIAHEGLLQLVAKRLETKETTEQLLQAFRVFDQQLQGTIKPEELRHIVTILAMQPTHWAMQRKNSGSVLRALSTVPQGANFPKCAKQEAAGTG